MTQDSEQPVDDEPVASSRPALLSYESRTGYVPPVNVLTATFLFMAGFGTSVTAVILGGMIYDRTVKHCGFDLILVPMRWLAGLGMLMAIPVVGRRIGAFQAKPVDGWFKVGLKTGGWVAGLIAGLFLITTW